VAQVNLDDQLPGPELAGELTQDGLILVGEHAEGQLIAEVLGYLSLFADGGLVIEGLAVISGAEGATQFVGGADVHADQEPAASMLPSGPLVDMSGQVPPAAQVEVPDAEVRALGNAEGLLKRGQQGLVDVVKYSWHEPPATYFLVIYGQMRQSTGAFSTIQTNPKIA